MGYPRVTLTETGRIKGLRVLFVAFLVYSAFSLCTVLIGIYLQISIKDKIHLINNFSIDVFSGYMISVGVVNLLVSTWGCHIFLVEQDVERRDSYQSYFLIFVITAGLITVFMFSIGVLCFVQNANLEKHIKSGIFAAMLEYGFNPFLKTEIDKLQIYYRCCGSESYVDWFGVSWLENGNNNDRKIINIRVHDTVPFSCCDIRKLRPCIHYHVHHNKRHWQYDFRKETTLYETGCASALLKSFGHFLLETLGGICFLLSLLQLCAVLLARFIQTSIANALNDSTPEGSSKGYLFPCSFKKWKMHRKGEKKLKKIKRHKIYTNEATPFNVKNPRYVDQEDVNIYEEIQYSQGDDKQPFPLGSASHQAVSSQMAEQPTYRSSINLTLKAEPYSQQTRGLPTLVIPAQQSSEA